MRGEEDSFLPPHRSAAWLRANFPGTGNGEVTLRILPDADHSLLMLESPKEFAPGYPELLVDWLLDVTGP